MTASQEGIGADGIRETALEYSQSSEKQAGVCTRENRLWKPF